MTSNKKSLLFPFLLIFYEIAIYLSNDMYLPSMPTIARELLYTQEQVQYTLTAWFLGASSLQLFLGPISDSYGRKRLMVVGATLFTLSSAICAVTSNYYAFLTARFIQGTSICSALVIGYAAIHELYDTRQVIKIFALMGAITIMAPALGPLAGAVLVQFASWRYIFWLLFTMGMISVITLSMYMPSSQQNTQKLHLAGFIYDYKKIFTNKKFMLLSISNAILIGVYFVWMFESPFVMMEVYNKSSLYYGLAQTFIFSCFFVGSILTNLVLKYNKVATLIKLASGLTLLGAFFFLLAAISFDHMLGSIASMMVLSVGASMLFGPINRITIESSRQPMGKRTAVFSTITSLFGAGIGSLLTFIRPDSLAVMSILVAICAFISIAMLFQADMTNK